MRTAAALAFLFLIGFSPAFAGDYFHACSEASGEFVINDGVLQAQRPASASDAQPEIKFKETRRITISREEGRCYSASCKQSFAYGSETYLLFAEFEHEGRRQRATFVCELAASGLPAGCDCGKNSVTFRQNLKPAFTTTGKPQKGRQPAP